jgi:integrase
MVFSPDNAKKREKRSQKLTIEDILKILRYVFNYSYEDYVILNLLVFCGMRISEAVSIERKDIDLAQRILITGKENGARKSNRKGDKPLIFCYPPQIANLMFEYLYYSENKYPQSKWLFPSSKRSKDHIGEFTIQDHIRDYSKTLQIDLYTHIFRKTLAKNRKNSGVSLSTREFLSNHVVKSTEEMVYAYDDSKEGVEFRVNEYDRTLPLEYVSILELVASL